MAMRTRTRTWHFVGLAVLLGSGAFSLAATPPAGSAPVQELWRKVEAAGKFTFGAPWRCPMPWRIAHGLKALEEIIRNYPGGVDEAAARLRIARIPAGCQTDSGRNAAMYQTGLAQDILRKLIAKAPDTPGLAGAVADAGRAEAGFGKDWSAQSFAGDAADCLRARWKGGADDAAQAGFMLAIHFTSDPAARRVLLKDLSDRFPKSPWAAFAQFSIVRDDNRRPKAEDGVLPYIEFADAHQKEDIGGLSLFWAATLLGQGPWLIPEDQKGRDPIPRWTRAMELYLRLAKEHPELDVERMEGLLGLPPVRGITLSAFGPKFGPDTAGFERLCQEYVSLRPGEVHDAIVGALVDMNRLRAGPLAPPETHRPKVAEYLIRFWDGVEKIADPNRMEEVLLGRAWFFARVGSEGRDSTEVRRTCERMRKDYPRGRFTAPALDLLAVQAEDGKQGEEAVAHWRRLIEEHPTHPLAGPGAVHVAELDARPGGGEKWRGALADARKRFADDPVLEAAVPALRGESFEAEDFPAEAAGEYRQALKAWHPYWPDVLEIGTRLGGLSSHQRLIGLEVSRLVIQEKLGELEPFEKGGFKDLVLYRKALRAKGEEGVALLKKVLADFPESPLGARAWIGIANALAGMEKYDDARQAYASAIKSPRASSADALIARLLIARLNYHRLGTVKTKLDDKELAEARKLVQDLASEDAQVRAGAVAKLLALGPAATEVLEAARRTGSKEVADRAGELLEKTYLAETVEALRLYREAVLTKKLGDGLAGELAFLNRTLWLGPLPWTVSKDPGKCWLVNGTLDVVLHDGTRQKVRVSHDFDQYEKAACIGEKDMLRLVEAMGISGKPGPGEDGYPRQVLRKALVVGEAADGPGGAGSVLLSPTLRIGGVRFLDKDRTKVEIRYSQGDRGGTVRLEKRSGMWYLTEASEQWRK